MGARDAAVKMIYGAHSLEGNTDTQPLTTVAEWDGKGSSGMPVLRREMQSGLGITEKFYLG